jgi:hypothetical protein
MSKATKIENSAETVVARTSEQFQAASERMKEYAETGMARAKEGYEQIVKNAQTANENARKAATKASLTMLDVAKEDTDAAYALARDLLNAKSLSDAFNIHMAYLKGRYETRVAQAQEFGAYVKETSEEAAAPLREGFAKLIPMTKKAA